MHLHIEAETIQDFRPTIRGPRPPAAPIPIGKTQYNAQLDLFWLPGALGVPAFLEAKFNARKEDHQWITIDRPPSVAGFVGSETMNAIKGIAGENPLGMGTGGDYTEIPFAQDSIILHVQEHVGGIGQTAKDLITVLEKQITGGSIVNIVNSSMQLAIGFPEYAFTGHQDNFAMDFEIIYQLLDFKQRSRSIQHRKRYSGVARIQPLNSDTMKKVDWLLKLHNCEAALSEKGKAS
jgi:hypothetical protein